MARKIKSFAFLFAILCCISVALVQKGQSQMLYGSAETSAECGNLVYWVRGGDFVPDNFLVQGGKEGTNILYICRVHRKHYSNPVKILVGKFVKATGGTRSKSKCYVVDGGYQFIYDDPKDYEVLVDYDKGAKNLVWEEAGFGGVAPLHSFWAGQTQDSAGIYVGQCTLVDTTTNGGSSITSPGMTGFNRPGSIVRMSIDFQGTLTSCIPERVLVCNF